MPIHLFLIHTNNMITINNTEYKVKFGLRAMFVFEQITKKRYSIDDTMDLYLLYYSMILANNKDCTLTFDELIDAIDDDPKLTAEFNNALSEKSAMDKILDGQGEESKNAASL